ncbi:hypothetical protein [Paraburkholderia sp. RAU2J]|nr:hypothetical protein [Paraburkholderia sp. RAU2J]
MARAGCERVFEDTERGESRTHGIDRAARRIATR